MGEEILVNKYETKCIISTILNENFTRMISEFIVCFIDLSEF